jgi:hypothetical protein
MSPTKLIVRENFTTYACWLTPGGPINKVNQVKVNKKYGTVLDKLPL